jgi:hypothetical protein
VVAALAIGSTFVAAMAEVGCSSDPPSPVNWTGGGASTGTGTGTNGTVSTAVGCSLYNAAGADLTTPRSFKTDVLPVFQVSCAVGGQACHSNDPGGNATPGVLVLGSEDGGAIDPGSVITSLVGVMAKLEPNMNLVTAGDPTNSFLMHKMDGDQCAQTLVNDCNQSPSYRTVYPNCGCAMPIALEAGTLSAGQCPAGPPVRQASRDKVRAWIAQGAKNN